MLRVIIVLIITTVFLFFTDINLKEKIVNNEPIDIVYTWVDGNDKEWLKIKNQYSTTGIGNIDKRFKNINEIKYSLRSVEKYLPWVNHIYIVVADGQKPNFLKDNNPKITIVKHSEIFKNNNDLPTFNSHAIESNLQNIPGLSEYFLYFNDDCFVGNFIKKEHFLTTKPHYYTKNKFLKDLEINKNDSGVIGAWKNNFLILEKKFNICDRIRPWHFPVLCKKSLIEKLVKEYPEEYNRTSKSRFRLFSDIAPIGFSIKYGYLSNIYIKKPFLKSIYLSYENLTNLELKQKLNNINLNKPYFFCINNFTPENKIKENLLFNFLENYYPEKSSFEK